MSDPLDPRRRALAIIDHVLNRRQTLDDALDAVLRQHPLEKRDRAFAHALARACLRNLGFIEIVLERFLTEGVPAKCRYAALVLRGGVTQILFMDVPDHAAVDSSVRLIAGAKHRADRGMKPVINAVLRRVARERTELVAELEQDPTRILAPWLAERWTATYGLDTTKAIARVLRTEPPLDLTLRSPDDAQDLAEKCQAELLPTGSLRIARPPDVTGLPGFEEGRFWVQDVAATLPVRLLPGKDAVVDLCAAPGGKTLQLAANGAPVLAVDRSAKRLKRVQENLARTGLAATLVTADATSWVPPVPPTRLLLDAPCSATGTLRRHPDTGWLKSEADIEKLVDLQARLLDHVASIMAPGGVFVYCVCSLEPEEGEAQVNGFLARHGDQYQRLPVAAEELPELETAITVTGDVRTLPSHWEDCGGMDGFFIARFQRRS